MAGTSTTMTLAEIAAKLQSSAADLEKKAQAVSTKVSKMTSGDGVKPEDATAVLKKALAAAASLCADQSKVVQPFVEPVRTAVPEAGDALETIATDLAKKSQAVLTKSKKLLGGSAPNTPRDAAGGEQQGEPLQPAAAVEMLKKALAAMTALATDNSGKLKAISDAVKQAADHEASAGSGGGEAAAEPKELDDKPREVTPPPPSPPAEDTSAPPPQPQEEPKKATTPPAPAPTGNDDELAQQLQVALAEKQMLEADLEQSNANNEENQRRLEEALAELAVAQKQVQDGNVEAEAAHKAEVDTLSTKIDTLETAAHEAAETVAAKDAEIAEKTQAHAEAVEKLESEHAAAKEQLVAQHAAEMTKQQEAHATATAEAKAASDAAIDERDKLIAELRARIAELESQLADAENRASREAQAAVDATQRASEANQQRDVAQAAKAEADRQRGVAEANAVALKAGTEQLKQQATTAKLGSERESARWKQRVHELEMELDSLRSRLVDDHLRVLVRKQQADIDSLRAARIEDSRKLADALAAAQVARDAAATGAVPEIARADERVRDQHDIIRQLKHEMSTMEAGHLAIVRDLEAKLQRATLELIDAVGGIGGGGAQQDGGDDLDRQVTLGYPSSARAETLDRGCQADDGLLQHAHMELAAARQEAGLLAEELTIIKRELQARINELEAEVAHGEANHMQTTGALNDQIRVLQYKLRRAATSPRRADADAAVGDESPRAGGVSSPQSTARSVTISNNNVVVDASASDAANKANEERAAELQRVATALDRWRATVEKERGMLLVENEMAKAKVSALKRELQRQQQDYELRIARMESLHEGQTASIVDGVALRETFLPSRSQSLTDGNAAAANASCVTAAPSASAASPNAELSASSRKRLDALTAIDQELLQLHEKALVTDREADRERAEIDANIQRLKREVGVSQSTATYWVQAGDAVSAQTEQNRVADLEAQLAASEERLRGLLARTKDARQQTVSRSTSLMRDRQQFSAAVASP